MLIQTTSIATSCSHSNLHKIASTKIRCCWRAEVGSPLIDCQELDPRNFNNIRATSCRKMASMNAWRDVAQRFFVGEENTGCAGDLCFMQA
ncbi:hypothetical protein E2C01_046159 [Portunus trituberculatus]|uniref:Uncharacterized protein n=1 Tax=Portunus trituberculatus TaxID=210409 RepID=A0A5B7G4B6_PORTR|nr:hypothetical protein [Portunus trituberculatus]